VKYLVTGAAGFIGSHLARALLDAGHEVVAVDSFTDYYDPARKKENAAGLGVVRADLALDPVAELVAGVDGVFHLAGQPGVRAFGPVFADYLTRNPLATQRVFEAAAAAGVRVVYASSSSIYGDAERYPTPESTPPRPNSPYGITKLACEHLARATARSFGLDVVVLRYFNVYGPRQDPTSQYAGVISKFAALIAQDRPLTVFGDGGQTRDFVFVKDLARINALALASDYRGICNVGTGVSVTLLELIDALAACAGRQPEVRFEPPVAGDIRESAMAPARLMRVFGAAPATPLAEGLKALLASTSHQTPHDPQARVIV